MSRKRDLIREIEARKLRSDYLDAEVKLWSLESSFRTHAGRSATDHSLYAIGLVACIEVGVRVAIRRLIDHGSPYVGRISELKDELRLDFNIAMALHEKRVTFGDLVSHLVPVSNIPQIDSHFSALLGQKFKEVLAEIREFVEPSDATLFGDDEEDESLQHVHDEPPGQPEPPPLIVSDVRALLGTLGQLFRTRHDAAHEAEFESLSAEIFREYFAAAETFLHALDEIVSQAVEPNMPRNAFGLSIVQSREATKVRDRMQALYKRVTSLIPAVADEPERVESLLAALDTSQEAFEKYMDAVSNYRLALAGPISDNGMRSLEALTMIDLCTQRISILEGISRDLALDAEIAEQVRIGRATGEGPFCGS